MDDEAATDNNTGEEAHMDIDLRLPDGTEGKEDADDTSFNVEDIPTEDVSTDDDDEFEYDTDEERDMTRT